MPKGLSGSQKKKVKELFDTFSEGVFPNVNAFNRRAAEFLARLKKTE